MAFMIGLAGLRRAAGWSRAPARRLRPTRLAFEQLDARLALAVDQLWVDPGSPMSSAHPTGARLDPFQSLAEAQASVQHRLASGPQRRDIVVNIRGGTYDFDGPLVFTGVDSGRNGHTVTWRAAPGEVPVFSGTQQITGWQPVANPDLVGLGFNVLWMADVGTLSIPGRLEFKARQLFIDGARGTVAETNATAMPEDLLPTYPFGFRPLIGQYSYLDPVVGPNPNGIVYSDPLGSLVWNGIDWANPMDWDKVEGVSDPRRQQDVEAVSRMQWREFSIPVQSITPYDPAHILDMPSVTPDVAVGFIQMQEAPWRAATLSVAPSSNVPNAPPAQPLEPAVWTPWRVSKFVNSYQFLDRPNEWYYDRVGGNVYLVCPPLIDPNQHDIEVPVTESLLEVKGTIDRPVRNLSFQGITFTGATWLDPSFGDGYVPDQAGILIDGGRNPITHEWLNGLDTIGHSKFTKPTPGNVSVTYGRNIEFRANFFRDLGAVGIRFDEGTQSSRIVGNRFESISSSAIAVGGTSWARVDAKAAQRPRWLIDGPQFVTGFGTDAQPADPRSAVRDNALLQNTIVGTGVDYVDAPGIFVGFARNTVIANNRISQTSWSGIQIGWGWGLVDSPRFPGLPNASVTTWLPSTLPRPTAIGGTRVVRNVITDFLRDVYDGGAIYTSGAQGTGWADATLIQGNVCTGKRPAAGSNIIYTDGGTKWVRVRDNLLYDNPRGEFSMGPQFSLIDPVNSSLAELVDPVKGGAGGQVYQLFPFLNGQPYGSEIGGCATNGFINYVDNLWENRWAGDAFPFPLFDPTAARLKNVSDWPNNPLFYNPARQAYYDLMTSITFSRNRFLVYNRPGANPAIDQWFARHGYGGTWRPGAGG